LELPPVPKPKPPADGDPLLPIHPSSQ
jgi:hypothetical protein